MTAQTAHFDACSRIFSNGNNIRTCAATTYCAYQKAKMVAIKQQAYFEQHTYCVYFQAKTNSPLNAKQNSLMQSSMLIVR